jgi:hypothetical protein
MSGALRPLSGKNLCEAVPLWYGASMEALPRKHCNMRARSPTVGIPLAPSAVVAYSPPYACSAVISIVLEGSVRMLSPHIMNMAIPALMRDLSADMVTICSEGGNCECTCQGDDSDARLIPHWRECGHAGPMPHTYLMRAVHVAETDEMARAEADGPILRSDRLGIEPLARTRLGFKGNPDTIVRSERARGTRVQRASYD